MPKTFSCTQKGTIYTEALCMLLFLATHHGENESWPPPDHNRADPRPQCPPVRALHISFIHRTWTEKWRAGSIGRHPPAAAPAENSRTTPTRTVRWESQTSALFAWQTFMLKLRTSPLWLASSEKVLKTSPSE